MKSFEEFLEERRLLAEKAMEYSLSNVVGDPQSGKRFSADLLEDGIAIAKCTKPSGHGHEMKFKFYTERSMHRFQDWCNTLSMEEGIWTLFTHVPKDKRK